MQFKNVFNLKYLLFIGCLICSTYACTLDDGSEDVQIVPEKYELLFSYGEQAESYLRRSLIDYFQMVALETEFGQNLPLVKKWTRPMLVYYNGSPDPELETELHKIIEELNPLFTDGFEIQLVEDSLVSNYHVYFGDKATYSKLYPSAAPYLKDNHGLFTYYLNPDFSIASGHMFVNILDIQMRYQKHILREEFTQSLGLPNDIDYYSNSVFYKKWSSVQAYSDRDLEVIRLLYHPQMIPKIDAGSVTSILENILGI